MRAIECNKRNDPTFSDEVKKRHFIGQPRAQMNT